MATLFEQSSSDGETLGTSSSGDERTRGAAPDRIARFVLLEQIGHGGMGELHAAYDPRLDRKIALKLVRGEARGGQASARLLREAQALAKLSHPNVVTVHEVGVAPGRGVYITMEYVRGRTLSKWLVEAEDDGGHERERIRLLLRLFRDAGRGLDAVHQAGLAHRDFKPDNVIVGEDGRVRVIDFGLARSVLEVVGEGEGAPAAEQDGDGWPLDETGPLSDADLDELTPNIEISTLTRAGALIGTPRYMAPEQWLTQRGDSRSDQFGFCVALYRALYREWPFAGETRRELMDAVLRGAVRPPPRKPEVSDRLQAAILRGLARDPDARAADMSELLAAIDELLEPKSRPLTWALLVALAMTMLFALWSWTAAGRGPGSITGVFAQAERELRTERRRAQVDAEVEALDAAGRHADADAAFLAFAGQRQHARTDALARAWIGQAQRLRAREQIDEELAALGEAQIASATAGQRRAALVELIVALDRSNRLAERGTALAELERIGPGEHGRPGDELWAIGVRDAVYRRDFVGASERLEQAPDHPLAQGLAPIVGELGRALATEHPVAGFHHRTGVIALPGVDLDHDGRDDLLLWSGGERARVLGASPVLPVLQELTLPGVDADDTGFVPLGRADGRAPAYGVMAGTGRTRVFEVAQTDASRVEARPVVEHAGVLSHWALADLRGGPGWDGAELWAADSGGRRLVGYRRRGGRDRFEPIELEPSLAAETSVVNSLAVGDLDGDGGDELLVGLGAWWAYDLRVMRPVAAAEPDEARFELLARRKLGSVDALALIPAADAAGAGDHRRWIAASITATPPNLRVFPGPSATGEAPGLHLLAWRDGELELVESFESFGVASPGSLTTGDVDGDGRDELLAQGYGGLGIWAVTGDRRYAGLWLDGVRLHALADLDGDGDDELLVSDLHAAADAGGRETLTVIGLGAGSLTRLERSRADLSAPPIGLEPELAEHWRRADVLYHSGLPVQAVASFEALARLARPGVAAQVLGHAAALADGQLAPRIVADLYERAGDPASLARAVAIHERTHALADAARVAASLTTHPELPDDERATWRRRAAELRELASPDAWIAADFSAPLDDRWRIARPALVKREPAGLRVDSIAGAPLLERPIVWSGGALELELDLALERMEWGAGLIAELWPVAADGQVAAAPIVEVRFASWGGGGHYVLRLHDRLHLQPGAIGVERPLRGALPPAGQARFDLRLGLFAGREQAWVRWDSRGDGPPDSQLEGGLPLASPAAPGRYLLRLSATEEPWVRGTIRLERLRLAGAYDDPEAAPPSWREQVATAIVNDASTAALELLARPEGLDPRGLAWLRGLALDRAGEWTLAVAEFERALAGCEDPDVLERFGYALLLWPDRLGPTLRRVCGPEQFLRATAAVTQTTLFQHKDLLDIHRTLTTQLIELEREEPDDVELALVVMDLLTSRARGWYMQGLPEAAEADLRRVVELAERWRSAEDDPDSAPELVLELRRNRALAHVGYAAVLMHRKKPDEAMAALARALDAAAAPAIIADVIVARSMFKPLVGTALWVDVEAAQRGG